MRSKGGGFAIPTMMTPGSPLTAPVPRKSESGKGLALMGLGMFLFAAVDTQGKFLTDTLHPIQIVWTRQLGLLVGAIALLAWKGPSL